MWKIPFCTPSIRFWQCEKGLLRREWEVLCFRGVVWLLFSSLLLHSSTIAANGRSYGETQAGGPRPPSANFLLAPALLHIWILPLCSPCRRRLAILDVHVAGSDCNCLRYAVVLTELLHGHICGTWNFNLYFFLFFLFLINVGDVKAYHQIRLDPCH